MPNHPVGEKQGIWLKRVIFIGGFIATSVTLIKELRNRQKLKKQSEINENTKTANNKYKTMLNTWSLITILLAILTFLFFIVGSIPSPICGIGYTAGMVCFVNIKMTLTFYQIARLQYLFLDKRLISTKYGFSKWIFYALYSVGIICTVLISIAMVNGIAIRRGKYECFMIFKLGWSKYIIPLIPVYYVYDAVVSGMYVFKIIQIKNE